MDPVRELLIGMQWGDEGKGKIVDEAAARASMISHGKQKTVVIRYQGGANAGHSLYVPDGRGGFTKFVTHAAPSGLASNTDIATGPHALVHPEEYLRELKAARDLFGYVGDVFISERASVVFDFHKKIDLWWESQCTNKIGTTGSGIGPAYADAARRKTRMTFGEYVSDSFQDKLRDILRLKQPELEAAGVISSQRSVDDCHGELLAIHDPVRKELAQFKANLEYRMQEYVRNRHSIIGEGGQGTCLDMDMGTVPDVTSSHLLAGSFFSTLGLDPRAFKIYGIEKLYPTRVGSGLMPTLQDNEFGLRIAKKGFEFGATTGRPRRVGYPDLVLLRRAAMLNFVDGIIVTRADTCQDEEWTQCVAYSVDGTLTQEMPMDLAGVEPVYAGSFRWNLWGNSGLTGDALTAYEAAQRQQYIGGGWDSLPSGLRGYMEMKDAYVGKPTVAVSIGPNRGETIWRP